MSMDPQEIEKMVSELGLEAPRISAQEVEASIIAETYTVLPSGRATMCELTLIDGSLAHGKSVVACRENFNQELGNKAARARAFDAAWEQLAVVLQRKRYDDMMLRRYLDGCKLRDRYQD